MSGYQPPSPTGRRWAPCRPWQAWCGQPKDAANRTLCLAGCPVAAGAAAGCRCFVPIPDAPLATLEDAVQVLAVQRAYRNLNAAVEQYTAVLGESPLALVRCLSRTVSLLTLPWDDDVKKLWRAANPGSS
jgi:hypothetical protein